MAWQKIIIHLLSFLIVFYLLIATQLNKFTLLIAIILLLFNLYHLFNLVINPQTKTNFNIIKTNKKKSQNLYQSNFDIKKFEGTVRNAFQRNLNKNSSYIEQENKYWNNTHFSKSDKIEQLKDIRVSDLRRQTINKFSDDASLKQEALNIKRLRNYFQAKEVQSVSVIQQLRQMMLQKFASFGQTYKKIRVEDSQIKQMLLMIEQHINNKISMEYDRIMQDYNYINSFLHKCFSLSLTLTSTSSSSAIDYYQFIEMIKLIDKRDIMPSRCSPNLPPLQIKKELQSIKRSISSLPNFALAPNILKFELFFNYLKEDFKDQSLVFSKMQDDRGGLFKQGKRHIFKCNQNDCLYYSKEANIKSKCTSTAVLAFLCSNLKQYYKSNKSLIREIKFILNI